MTHLRLLIGSVAAVLTAAAGATVNATIPGSDGKLHTCLNAAGQVRVIDADLGTSCRPGETALALPAVAPTCPAGTTLLLGVCFEAARQATDWSNALITCAAEGKRLPTPTELFAFGIFQPIGFLTEWTGEIDSQRNAVAVASSGPGPGHQVITFGSVVTDLNPYRCVAPL